VHSSAGSINFSHLGMNWMILQSYTNVRVLKRREIYESRVIDPVKVLYWLRRRQARACLR
jgi:hypothetical protein